MESGRTKRGARARQPTLWSLRPAGEHAGLRQAAQGAGFRLRALPLQRLAACAAGAALDDALAAPIRIFSSPAAVRFALAAGARRSERGIDLAVGAGTAAALRAAGAIDVRYPERMDSEGLLALPELQQVEGMAIGLVTAPRGRGLLGAALRERGARLQLAEVYQRLALHGGARRLADFIDDDDAVLLASSAEALGLLLARLPSADTAPGRRLRARPAVASSARLAERLRADAFSDVRCADAPTPPALVQAAFAPSPYTGDAAAGRAPLRSKS
jgi:uroporphyrinogen-III synthase